MAYPGFLVITSEEYNDPQPLFVDGESLGVNRDIGKNGASARLNRETRLGDFRNKGEKPSGAITYTFRSSDVLKPLFAHFQSGTTDGSGPYRYTFYPLVAPSRNQTTGDYSLGTYGVEPQRTYFVRATKKLTSGVPFSFYYGVVDKLEFNFQASETSSVTANFLFKDFTICENTISLRDNLVVENFMDVPPGTVAGTYATTEAFNFSDVALLFNGTTFPLDKLTFASDQGMQTIKTVGKRNPNQYLQGNYTVKGKFSFDLPSDASTLVGSMLTMGTFSIVGTAYHTASDRVMFSMPACVKQPFDFNANSTLAATGEIPFEAIHSAGVPPLQMTVDTSYAFYPMLGITVISDRTTHGTTITDRTDHTDTITVTT